MQHRFWILIKRKTITMKTLILAASIIAIGMVSCTTSQPAERVYYPSQPVYSNSPYAYNNDQYYNPAYDSRYYRRVYDYNTGRYYNVPINSAPVYTQRYDRREYQRNEEYREQAKQNNGRREEYQEQSRRNNERREEYKEQPKANTEVQHKRLLNGTVISSDGTVTLPNGQVRQK